MCHVSYQKSVKEADWMPGTRMSRSPLYRLTQRFDLIEILIDDSWKQLRQDLEGQLNNDKLEVLFSDGVPGIEENMLSSGMRCQQYVWNVTREFPYNLYADQAKTPSRSRCSRLRSPPNW